MQHATARYENLRDIAAIYFGCDGTWAYDAFEFINARCFGDGLPVPAIQWALTAHGGCLGLTRSGGEPVITLHPSILGGTEKLNPWGFPSEWLGRCFAFDTLVHELMHVSVIERSGFLRGGGSSSHNNDVWVSEVNRIAPLLGLSKFQASRSRTRRVAGKVCRVVDDGAAPFEPVSKFPRGARIFFGTADSYYRRGVSPFDEAGTGNAQLHVTAAKAAERGRP